MTAHSKQPRFRIVLGGMVGAGAQAPAAGESRSAEAVGKKIISDGEVSFGPKPNIMTAGSGAKTHRRVSGDHRPRQQAANDMRVQERKVAEALALQKRDLEKFEAVGAGSQVRRRIFHNLGAVQPRHVWHLHSSTTKVPKHDSKPAAAAAGAPPEDGRPLGDSGHEVCEYKWRNPSLSFGEANEFDCFYCESNQPSHISPPTFLVSRSGQ